MPGPPTGPCLSHRTQLLPAPLLHLPGAGAGAPRHQGHRRWDILLPNPQPPPRWAPRGADGVTVTQAPSPTSPSCTSARAPGCCPAPWTHSGTKRCFFTGCCCTGTPGVSRRSPPLWWWRSSTRTEGYGTYGWGAPVGGGQTPCPSNALQGAGGFLGRSVCTPDVWLDVGRRRPPRLRRYSLGGPGGPAGELLAAFELLHDTEVRGW